MGINYCKEDKLDEKRPCKVIYDDGTIVTIEDELKHVETMKKQLSPQWTQIKLAPTMVRRKVDHNKNV